MFKTEFDNNAKSKNPNAKTYPHTILKDDTPEFIPEFETRIPIPQSMIRSMSKPIVSVLTRQDEHKQIRMYAYPVMSRNPEFKYMINIDAITLSDLTKSEADEAIGGLLAVLKRREWRAAENEL